MKYFVISVLISISCWKAAFSQEVNPNGENKFTYPNGVVSSEGRMRDGKPDGFWRTYYENGQLKTAGNRINFKLDSIWVFYTQQGDTLEKIAYRAGEKNGFALKFQYGDTLQNIPVERELWINNKREGQAIYYYPSGRVREKVIYTQGMRQGEGRVYNELGQVIALNVYKNNFLVYQERINQRDIRGLRQGVWREYYGNGKIQLESNYKNDKLHGYVKTFNTEGKLLEQNRYEFGNLVVETENKGPKIEPRRTYHANGQVQKVGGFLNDKPVGLHREFTADGDVFASEIFTNEGILQAQGRVLMNGQKDGKWVDLYPDGAPQAQGEYDNGKRQGTWIFRFPNGKVEQKGNYIKGKLDGLWTWYYPTGEVWREEEYLNGKREGEWVEYMRDGKVISKGNYEADERTGAWVLQLGDHSEQGNYLDGERNGEWKFFFEDGTLKFEGRFAGGEPTGTHKYYFESGKLNEIREYIAGLENGKWKKYDQEGILTFEIEYKNGQEIKIDGLDVVN